MIIAVVHLMCSDVIVWILPHFLFLHLSTRMHSLIKDAALLLRAERFIKIGSQFGVKNGVVKLLTCWDINKSKVFVCKPWRLILYNSMSCLCFYDWCFKMFEAWCKPRRSGLTMWLAEAQKCQLGLDFFFLSVLFCWEIIVVLPELL